MYLFPVSNASPTTVTRYDFEVDNKNFNSRIEEIRAEATKLNERLSKCLAIRSSVSRGMLTYPLMNIVVLPLAVSISITGSPLLALQISCSTICTATFVISNSLSIYAFYLQKQTEWLAQEAESIQNILYSTKNTLDSTLEKNKNRLKDLYSSWKIASYSFDCANTSFVAMLSLNPLLDCTMGFRIQKLAIVLKGISLIALASTIGFSCYALTLFIKSITEIDNKHRNPY